MVLADQPVPSQSKHFIPSSPQGSLIGNRDYFFRTPVSVLLKLFVALLAAGVSTALSCEVGA
jgi:hypothetical protein